MKQTNLQMIKEVSKMLFTAVPIESVEGFSFLVQHPFASNSIVAVPKGENLKAYTRAIHKELDRGVDPKTHIVKMSKMRIDYLEDLVNNILKNNLIDITIPEGAEIYKRQIFKFIDEAENLTDILMLLNKPWYMTFIKYTEAYMSDEDLGDILGDCWVEQEYPSRDNNVSLKEIIAWFRRSTKKKLMDDTELESYLSLILEDNLSLTVYRGVSFDGKPEGLSWTTDLEKARWFSTRFGSENSRIYKMTITDPSSILAVFTGRKESELVIDTTKSNNWEEVKGDTYGK